jgi:hypothetical protein
MRPDPLFGSSPRRFVAAAALACAVLVTAACAGATPTSVPTDEPLDGLQLTMSARDVALLATGAFADFGVNGGGARQVRVRILDRLGLNLRIAADRPITLAEPPVVCLVGPYSAPDDAGLESPCWGEPDLSSALMAKLGQDGTGHYLLTPDQPIELAVELSRGTRRCDYPPGAWQLELKLNPLSGGNAAGARYVPDTPFDVPISQTGPLTLLPTTETRYCGLATAVVQQQGEPEVSAPAP